MTGAVPPSGPDPGPAAEVLAAGAVLWRSAGGVEHGAGGYDVESVQVAVVHRPRYDDWSLPKGKLETAESPLEAAVREVAEETGHPSRLGARLGEVRYQVPEGPKTVHYWAAEALGGEFTPGSEVDELRWLSPKQAGTVLSHQRDVDLLDRFLRLGLPDGVLLVVRHAKAGSRHAWDGPDHQRPLSAAGRLQADALPGMLALFGPDRIHSAPPVRCTQTVRPLAERLSLEVHIEPLLGEEGYWEHPDAGRRRLLDIGTQGGATVVCSQGGVIPGVVQAIAEQVGRGTELAGPKGQPESRKGSTWVLGLREKRLLFADYYPPTV